jgi:hypothetical protein
MSKITPDHLARQAYVYVRQSTPDQLLHNHERAGFGNLNSGISGVSA